MPSLSPMNTKFNAKSTAADVVKGLDLRGKNAIITGGSSGLGLETARALASAGADVTIAVRDLKKGTGVADQLIRDTNNPNIHVMPLELSSFESCRAFGKAYCDLNQPLHILVNNAAIMAGPLERNEFGHEAQFATNHLGHFVMTKELLPALEKAQRARVVVLSSIGHRLSPVVFEDIHFQNRAYDKWLAYGQAKSANALFAFEFNRRFQHKGITANAVHPGAIMTGLQKNLSNDEMRAMNWIDAQGNVNEIFKTPQQGAATSVWAATAPEIEGRGGLYLEDCNEGAKMDPQNPRSGGYVPHIQDPESAQLLWRVSEEMVESR